MALTDPIADMLTRVRNASSSRHPYVEMPASKIKEVLARILMEEGFIRSYEVMPQVPRDVLRLELKYGPEQVPLIRGIKRVSKPGRRVYVKKQGIPRVLNGLGIVILSTPKGILVGAKSAKENVGGEVLCYVW